MQNRYRINLISGLKVTLSHNSHCRSSFFWNVDLAITTGTWYSAQLRTWLGYASLMSYPWTAHFDACPSLFSQMFTTHACATGVLSDTYTAVFQKVAAGALQLNSLGQLTSHPLNWPSFGKGETKDSWVTPRLRFDVFMHWLCAHYKLFLRLWLRLRYRFTASADNVSIHWYDTHQKHQNRTIKTTISQQYTSFVFPFAETRSMDVMSVDRENPSTVASDFESGLECHRRQLSERATHVTHLHIVTFTARIRHIGKRQFYCGGKFRHRITWNLLLRRKTNKKQYFTVLFVVNVSN